MENREDDQPHPSARVVLESFFLYKARKPNEKLSQCSFKPETYADSELTVVSTTG